MAEPEPKGPSEDAEPPKTPFIEEAEGIGKRENDPSREPNPLRRALKLLGPGLITGASDDDPTAIGTYSVAGASFGYAMLWTALVTFPMMAAVQYISAKVGLVSGRGLAGVLRREYPRKWLYPALIALTIANVITVGADIGAIATAVNLLVPIPVSALIVPVSLLILGLLILGSYRLIANVFKWLTLALFAYVGAAFLARPDWGEVLRGTFLPSIRLDSRYLATLVAILGTNISPYLFFWQASQEVEEEVSMGRRRLWQRRGTTDAELRYAAWDIDAGMLFSNLVVFFINLATAATLFAAGTTDIRSAADAAAALRPLAGDAATILFALGMIGSGFLAVPVLLGSSAYALSETFGWRWGLDQNPARAKQFYGVIILSVLVGMEINFVGINPIDALFWAAAINGVLAAPILVLVLLVANNRRVMGDRVNGRWLNLLGWLTTAAMFLASVGLFATWGG